MPEEVSPTIETPQPVQPTEPKSIAWTKIILGAIVGLGLLAGSAYAGYYYGTQQVQQPEKPASVVSQPTPTPEPTTPSPTTYPTANWETYRNEKYSFEIKYPQPWKLEEKETAWVNNVVELAEMETNIPLSLVGVTGPKTGHYGVEVYAVPNPKDKNFHDLVFSSFGFINEEINFREEKLGDYKVFKTVDFPSGDGRLDVFLEMGGGLSYIHLRLHPYGGDHPYENQTEMLSIFNQILSTFKFLD